MQATTESTTSAPVGRATAGGISSDVMWLAFIGFVAGACVLRHFKEPNHSAILPIGGMGIVVLTAVWLPLRMLPLLVALSEKRRREEMALASVSARIYLRERLKRAWIVPALAACIAMGLLIWDITFPQPDKWFLPLFVITLSSIALNMSAISIFILFRWMCRSPRNRGWSWVASVVTALSVLICDFLVQVATEGLKAALPSVTDTIIMSAFYPIVMVATFVLARWAWRRCWTKYFVFE